MCEGRGSKNLSNEEMNVIAQWLIQNSCHNNYLRHGAKKEAAILFKVGLRTIFRIWKAASIQKNLGIAVNVVSMKKRCIHPSRAKLLDEEKVRSLSFNERSSIRKLLAHLGVSVGLLHKWIKKKKIRPHTNAIKPYLTDANKLARLKWSLSMLSCISANGKIAFQTMYNIVHIDEKWFNLTKTTSRCYRLKDEVGPHRTCKLKKFIEKIMFMCCISRPQKDCNGNIVFDGKFGIFPFITIEPAARNSKNRSAGTMVTKPIQSITKAVIKDCFIHKIIPVIKAKWPQGASKNIIIQQDNARPHINNEDLDFQAAAQSDGFNIKRVCQPPNSPDTNVNDLGFFRSIQALKDEKSAKIVDDLILNVEEAFEEYDWIKLNDVFLTLQACYNEIIKVKGSNKYEIPHMGKARLRSLGLLPECIEVDEVLVQESLEYLNGEMSENLSEICLESLVHGITQLHIEG